MRNIVDVTGGKPIVFLYQFVSRVRVYNTFATFYDTHGRNINNRVELLFFFCCLRHHTRQIHCN
jgi:hypothetical protein